MEQISPEEKLDMAHRLMLGEVDAVRKECRVLTKMVTEQAAHCFALQGLMIKVARDAGLNSDEILDVMEHKKQEKLLQLKKGLKAKDQSEYEIIWGADDL